MQGHLWQGRYAIGPFSARVVSHQKEEWRLPCGIAWPIVMRELRYWQIGCPVGLLMIREETQISLQPLIGPFRLSVRSGVIRRGRIALYACQPTDFPDEFRCESGISVAYHLSR